MTRGLSFVDAFWDPDIVGTIGWDRLNRRMKDGKKVCTDIAHYYKDRAKAELDYSKALLNLAKRADGKEETGILGDGWRELKRQSEKMCQVHEQAGVNFNILHQELTKFNEEQSRQKKQHEDAVRRSSQNKITEYQKVQNLKKNYEQKCREYDVSKESYETSTKTVTSKRNEVEKAKQKYDKCHDAMGNADLSYRSSIESMDAARINWEKQMEAACKELEVLEAGRLEVLRDNVWRCTNIDSASCLAHDDCCERVRERLEQCDVMDDLEHFVEHNRIGGQRPGRVEYEQYYQKKPSPGPPARPPNTGQMVYPPGAGLMAHASGGLAPTTRTLDSRPPQLPSGGLAPTTRTLDSRPPQLPPQLPPQPRLPQRTPSLEDRDGPYSTVDALQSPSAPSNVLLKVVHSHLAANPSELEVQAGDVLQLLKPSNRYHMITVKYPDERRVGVIPETCAVPVRTSYSTRI